MSPLAFAAVAVWAIDDGEKIKQDSPPPSDNPVWSAGQPVRLIAAKNETVAFQVVVTADEKPLAKVSVDLESLASDSSTIRSTSTDPTQFVGRPIERFVEHFFDVARPSGGKTPGESLGWLSGAAPPPGKYTGRIADALVPIEVAPPWSPYPMAIAPKTNGVVWIDVTIGKDRPAGLYRGNVVVADGGTPLATLPVELQVADVTLADRPVKTMLCYDRSDLEQRMGAASAAAAEKHLFELYHRHRLSPMHGANSATDVRVDALDGSLYTAANGYEGPAAGMGDGVLSIGTYGSLEPTADGLKAVEGIAAVLDKNGLFPTTDAFVYAADEDCENPAGAKWKQLLGGSATAKKIRVGWTCSEEPASQPVDIVMQLASFDAKKAQAARAAGKDVWSYNGIMPKTGTFLTDAPAIAPRVNGWLLATNDIGRWFYWETTFWYDGNRGGHGPYDPFVTAETFHNGDGDWANGDGVLVYPGKQVDRYTTHSIGMDGVIASVRLKNWRRGIQDAGYYQLAHAANASAAEAIAKALLPRVLASAKGAPSWSESGKPWFDARKALLALVPGGTNGGAGAGASAGPAPSPGGAPASTSRGCGCRSCSQAGTGALSLTPAAAILLVLRWRRARRASRDGART